MTKQQFLEFARIDVLAATDDHVLQATLDRAIAARVHRAEIAGMQPALGIDRGGGRFRHFEIAKHDVIAAGAKLADFADCGGLAGVGIDDLGFHVRQWQADSAGLVFDRIGRHGHGRHRRAFGLPEHDGEGRAEFLFEPPHQCRRHGRAAGTDRPDRRQVCRREVGMFEHGHQHGGNAEHGVAAVGPKHF